MLVAPPVSVILKISFEYIIIAVSVFLALRLKHSFNSILHWRRQFHLVTVLVRFMKLFQLLWHFWKIPFFRLLWWSYFKYDVCCGVIILPNDCFWYFHEKEVWYGIFCKNHLKIWNFLQESFETYLCYLHWEGLLIEFE